MIAGKKTVDDMKRKVEAVKESEMLQNKIDEDEEKIQNLKDQIRKLEEINAMRQYRIDELKPSTLTTREYYDIRRKFKMEGEG